MCEPTSRVSSDQTGILPQPSSKGNNYVFVLYNYSSNSIHTVAMKSRKAKCILEAYQTVFDRLKRAGLCPRLAHLNNNECSALLKQFFYNNDVEFQLAPPHILGC